MSALLVKQANSIYVPPYFPKVIYEIIKSYAYSENMIRMMKVLQRNIFIYPELGSYHRDYNIHLLTVDIITNIKICKHKIRCKKNNDQCVPKIIRVANGHHISDDMIMELHIEKFKKHDDVRCIMYYYEIVMILAWLMNITVYDVKNRIYFDRSILMIHF